MRLPRPVKAEFIVRNSQFDERLDARSVSFAGLLDFSGTNFVKGADFSDAQFAGPFIFAAATTGRGASTLFRFASFTGAAVFARAHLKGDTLLTGAEFHDTARFRKVAFAGRAFFGYSSFDRAADFARATFSGSASFGGTDFGSVANFAKASFRKNTAFTGARFAGTATFDEAEFKAQRRRISRVPGFVGSSQRTRPTAFGGVSFNGGASFLYATFEREAIFNDAQALQGVDFEGARFDRSASFTTVRFRGDTDLSHALLNRRVDFTQAVLHLLDLDGVTVGDKTVVVLPDPARRIGHLDDLRLDADEMIGPIEAGSPDAQIRQLKLVESAARSAGDRDAANKALVRRLTLNRYTESWWFHPVDWAFGWEISGYLIKWQKPACALLALVVLGILLRLARWNWKARVRVLRWLTWWKIRVPVLTRIRPRSNEAVPEKQIWVATKRSVVNLVRFKIEDRTALAWLETASQKLLVLVLLLTLGNVWPPVHDLLNGIVG